MVQERANDLTLKSDMFTVLYHSKGNMTLKDIGAELFLLDTIKPHLVFLDIGSHDLAQKKKWDAEKVLRNVWKLALHIIEHYKVLRVIICEIYPRKSTELYLTCENFAEKCMEYNKALREKCLKSETRNNFVIIGHLKHRGMYEAWQDFLHEDGFHLNADGTYSLAKILVRYMIWVQFAVAKDLGITLPERT